VPPAEDEVPKLPKTASSQAAWALITEGTSRARVDGHRLRHMMDRALKLIEGSEHKEHFYQMAGDIILGAPRMLDQLDQDLDRTLLALSKMGEEFLDSRLPLSDKVMVEEAVEAAFGKPRSHISMAEKVAKRYLDQE